MKPHERREQGAYPFFKLATWDGRSFTWRAGKSVVAGEGEARALAAGKSGRYRVERFDADGSRALEPFEV